MTTIPSSNITTRSQLTKENLDLIFKTYFKDESISVESIDGDGAEVGEHYQSDISRLVVKLNTNEHSIKLIVKEPIGQSFMQKVLSKIQKTFMRETFWYEEAYPEFVKLYPEIEEITPKCYHANSTYRGNYM